MAAKIKVIEGKYANPQATTGPNTGAQHGGSVAWVGNYLQSYCVMYTHHKTNTYYNRQGYNGFNYLNITRVI